MSIVDPEEWDEPQPVPIGGLWEGTYSDAAETVAVTGPEGYAEDRPYESVDLVNRAGQIFAAKLDGEIDVLNTDLADAAGRVAVVEAGLVTAQDTADAAAADATTALASASDAVTTAGAAQTTADAAATAAATADGKADDAQDTADQAVTDAATAQTTATNAITAANLADAAAKGMIKASQADPGQQEGRIWLQLDGSGRTIGIKISNGASWTSYALMADQVIVPGSVGTVLISDSAVTAPKINATSDLWTKLLTVAGDATIGGNLLVAGSVGTDELAANAVTADKIDVATLNGVTINGITINGSKFYSQDAVEPRENVTMQGTDISINGIIKAGGTEVGPGRVKISAKTGGYANFRTSAQGGGGQEIQIKSGAVRISTWATGDADTNAPIAQTYYAQCSAQYVQVRQGTSVGAGSYVGYASLEVSDGQAWLDLNQYPKTTGTTSGVRYQWDGMFAQGGARIDLGASAHLYSSAGSGSGRLSLFSSGQATLYGPGTNHFVSLSTSGIDVRTDAGTVRIQGTSTQLGTPSNWEFGTAHVAAIARQAALFRSEPTTTLAANTHIATNPAGVIFRSTSVRAAKANIQDMAVDPDIYLSLRPRTWVDRASADSVADAITRELDGEEIDWSEFPDLTRVPGLVAEEVEESGNGWLAQYGPDGELSGVSYDRGWVPLIGIVREMRDRITQLENQTQGAP